jgi:NADPH:quinone reductase-like Zn-dependent oxidoreductase/acyl carrier protein
MVARQRPSVEGLITLTQQLRILREDQQWRGLWLLTHNTQAVADDQQPRNIEAAPLWALRRSIATETPELHAGAMDLDGSEAGYRALAAELSHTFPDRQEDQIAFRDGKRYVQRLVAATLSSGGPLRLESTQPGQIHGLNLLAATRRAPGPGEAEVRVHAAGVNFRDVMGTLGMYPGDPGPLGAECAGEIAESGAEVTSVHKGDRVVALAAGSMASFVVAPAKLIWRIPDALSFEEAATIPVAFLTAYYALFGLARIAPGERLLVHSGTGGVGMAAVQLALRHGVRVIATAGSVEKRALLRSMGAHFVFDSRTPEFAADTLNATSGIDVVLNSLAGPLIDAGLSTLQRGGRFVEIGKAETRESDEIMARWPGVRYERFDLGELALKEPELIHRMLAHILDEVAAGRLRPLPARSYPLARAEDAFRFMAQRKHVGKLLLCPATESSSDAGDAETYLITGGLGAIGCELARWLVERGARSVFLVGRSLPSPTASALISELRAEGVRVETRRADVSNEEELDAVFTEAASTMPPIRTVFHAAGVLRDRELSSLSWADCEAVALPKTAGAWNLLRSPAASSVERIILFSSMASLVSPPGQAAYSMANEFLDALAQSSGPRFLAIDWGPWKEAGMATHGSAEKAERYGILPFSTPEALRHLDALLASSAEGRIVAMQIDPARFRRAFALLGRPRGLALVGAAEPLEANSGKTDAKAGPSLLAVIAALPAGERRIRLREYLTSAAARTLGMPASDIDPDRALQEMGLDSMMAVELRNELRKTLEADIAATALFDYPTIFRLATYIENQVLCWKEEAALDNLSDEQVAELLAQELTSLGRLNSK